MFGVKRQQGIHDSHPQDVHDDDEENREERGGTTPMIDGGSSKEPALGRTTVKCNILLGRSATLVRVARYPPTVWSLPMAMRHVCKLLVHRASSVQTTAQAMYAPK